MSDKRAIYDKMMSLFDRLKRIGADHSACLSDFQKLIHDFIKSDFIKYQRPEHYADCLGENDLPPVDPVTANLPPELASLILLLLVELKNQASALKSSQAMLEIFAEQFHIALDNCDNCASCHNLFARTFLRPVEEKGILKFICNDCFEEEYFDCHKCKRVLPNSEQGEEDTQLGYGWICKDCLKPIGFPQEVVIAPDFPGCEEVAALSLSELREYASNASGGRMPDNQDTIKLKLLKRLSEYDALYGSPKGAKYEIGELDYRGIGDMRELEEDLDS